MACKWILKVLMVVFNSAIFLAGAATVVIGVLVEMKKNNILKVLDIIKDNSPELAHLSNAGYLLIGVGAILTFMGFLGCCGACCDNKCMLMTWSNEANEANRSLNEQFGAQSSNCTKFFIIILILFVVEVVAAVYILLYQSKVEEVLDKVREKVGEKIKENYDKNSDFTAAWNETMSLMKCCGFSNYTDFTGSVFVNRTSLYPQDCCSTEPSDKAIQCDGKAAASKSVHGCLDALVKLVKSQSSLLGAVAICIAALEVAAMIVSLILYNSNN